MEFQESFNTDFNLPDKQKKDKEQTDFGERQNLQVWVNQKKRNGLQSFGWNNTDILTSQGHLVKIKYPDDTIYYGVVVYVNEDKNLWAYWVENNESSAIRQFNLLTKRMAKPVSTNGLLTRFKASDVADYTVEILEYIKDPSYLITPENEHSLDYY
jgi:hypothetical protein